MTTVSNRSKSAKAGEITVQDAKPIPNFYLSEIESTRVQLPGVPGSLDAESVSWGSDDWKGGRTLLCVSITPQQAVMMGLRFVHFEQDTNDREQFAKAGYDMALLTGESQPPAPVQSPPANTPPANTPPADPFRAAVLKALELVNQLDALRHVELPDDLSDSYMDAARDSESLYKELSDLSRDYLILPATEDRESEVRK